MDIINKIDKVLKEELSKEKTLDLLDKGKIVYGVRESENEEDGKIWHVAEIKDKEEYKKSSYWDIVDTFNSEEEAVNRAKELAKKVKNGIYVGVEYD